PPLSPVPRHSHPPARHPFPTRRSSDLDEIAARIGMDPLAFRRRNVLGDRDLGATGQRFEGNVLGPMLERMDTLRDAAAPPPARRDRKSTRLNSSHVKISYAVFCLKKKR